SCRSITSVNECPPASEEVGGISHQDHRVDPRTGTLPAPTSTPRLLVVGRRHLREAWATVCRHGPRRRPTLRAHIKPTCTHPDTSTHQRSHVLLSIAHERLFYCAWHLHFLCALHAVVQNRQKCSLPHRPGPSSHQVQTAARPSRCLPTAFAVSHPLRPKAGH